MNRQLGQSRASSAGPDTKALRQTVIQLQQEVLQTKSELQKTTDQLNCLMMLVQRAWSGDKAAAAHVANIIGVAPPDIEMTDHHDRGVTLSAKPKSRALQNWALLTIGILNREYKRIQREVQTQQNLFLQNRQEYLEEQLLYHRDMVAKQQKPRKRTNTTDTVNRLFLKDQGKTQSRAQSAKSRPASGKHLYREPDNTSNQPNPLKWGDLVVEPVHKQGTGKAHSGHKTEDGFFKLTGDGQPNEHEDLYYIDDDGDDYEVGDGTEGSVPDPDRMKIRYDDPARYTQGGLYDSNSLVGSKKKRPISAVLQRKHDQARARPKSAVVSKSDRPLKYETTRPISAQVTNKLKKDKTTNQKQNDSKTKTSTGDKKRPPVQLTEAQLARIKRPESIDDYLEDVKKMNSMQDEIKKTTLALQKQLGIGPDAVIW